MDYGLFVTVFAYTVAVYSVLKYSAPPLLMAALSVGVPLAVNVAVAWILSGTNPALIWGVLASFLHWRGIVTLACQLVLMFFLLRYLRDTDSAVAFLAVPVIGFLVIIVAVPMIVGKVL